MNLSKIHHIAIIVSDYEAAKDFYVNKLGFSVIRENYRSERKDWKLVIYALSDFLIMILSWLVKQSLRAFLFQEVQP